mgnify:CR=1 FL=1
MGKGGMECSSMMSRARPPNISSNGLMWEVAWAATLYPSWMLGRRDGQVASPSMMATRLRKSLTVRTSRSATPLDHGLSVGMVRCWMPRSSRS